MNSYRAAYFVVGWRESNSKMGLSACAVLCSKVTSGMEVLHKLEALETRQEGIFVMPKEVGGGQCQHSGVRPGT